MPSVAPAPETKAGQQPAPAKPAAAAAPVTKPKLIPSGMVVQPPPKPVPQLPQHEYTPDNPSPVAKRVHAWLLSHELLAHHGMTRGGGRYALDAAHVRAAFAAHTQALHAAHNLTQLQLDACTATATASAVADHLNGAAAAKKAEVFVGERHALTGALTRVAARAAQFEAQQQQLEHHTANTTTVTTTNTTAVPAASAGAAAAAVAATATIAAPTVHRAHSNSSGGHGSHGRRDSKTSLDRSAAHHRYTFEPNGTYTHQCQPLLGATAMAPPRRGRWYVRAADGTVVLFRDPHLPPSATTATTAAAAAGTAAAATQVSSGESGRDDVSSAGAASPRGAQSAASASYNPFEPLPIVADGRAGHKGGGVRFLFVAFVAAESAGVANVGGSAVTIDGMAFSAAKRTHGKAPGEMWW